MTFVSRRNVAEMISWRSARHIAGVLAFSLLAWWSSTQPDPEIHTYATGIFCALAFGTLLLWLVRDPL